MDQRFIFLQVLFIYFFLVPGFLLPLRILEIDAYQTVCALLFVDYYRTLDEHFFFLFFFTPSF